MDGNVDSIRTNTFSHNQIEFLDGIRGLMALNVIICHFVVIYIPQMYFGRFAETYGGFLSLFATTPLSILVNGNIAVQYFFILTGFLVGRSFFIKEYRPEQILNKASQRWLRLLPTVAGATFFTWLTMTLNLQYHQIIAPDTMNPEYISAYCDFEPSLSSLLINAVIYPFIRFSEYIGPFWSVRYEFFGYIISMLVAYICRNSKWRKLAYGVIALLLLSQLNVNYIGFILGIFVADLIFNDRYDQLEPLYRGWIHNKTVVLFIFLVGLYLASCPMYFATIYRFLERIPKITTEIPRAVGMAMVLYALFHMPRLQKCLQHPILLLMGRISFSTYAFHWPLMLSLQAWLFYHLLPKTTYMTAALLAFIITVPVIYIFSYCMWLLLEKRSWMRRLFKNKQTL